MPDAASPPLPALEPERALIAPGAEFEGLLLLHGPARVEGRLRGEILGTTLWVGRSAALDARIEVDELCVSGAIAGSVRVRGRALLRATARVTADLEARSLALEEGSLLEGECRTGSARDGAGGAVRVPFLP
ncbi:MAG: polymer-forming cytoskeletal protein [Myxococcales bacterium]|nr:MAG: polymer-forming cytoskeletal protein [Myxococcales bacterium]